MTAWTDLTPVAYSVDYVDAAGIADANPARR